jgi:hypothetical protein
MRSSWIAAGVGWLAACGSQPRAMPPKPPNTELIVGAYERHKPEGETALRLRGDGSLRLAKTAAQLDAEPPLATGSWKLDGAKLSLTYDTGLCADHKTGEYTVVVSRIGIRFTKVSDDCARRATIDGQTWWRVR